MAEAGGLQALYEEHRDDGFMMITALDGDDPKKLLEWAEKFELTHPVVGDGAGAIMMLYGENYWPMPVVIDRGMVIKSVLNKPENFYETVVNLMEAK